MNIENLIQVEKRVSKLDHHICVGLKKALWNYSDSGMNGRYSFIRP